VARSWSSGPRCIAANSRGVAFGMEAQVHPVDAGGDDLTLPLGPAAAIGRELHGKAIVNETTDDLDDRGVHRRLAAGQVDLVGQSRFSQRTAGVREAADVLDLRGATATLPVAECAAEVARGEQVHPQGSGIDLLDGDAGEVRRGAAHAHDDAPRTSI
jgi:hypothetical protein